MDRATTVGCIIGVTLAFFIARWSNPRQSFNDDPPCDGIYQVQGYMPCESPWSKENNGSTQFFYTSDDYPGYLICALWTGGESHFEAYENGRAWGSQEAAESALSKKFEPRETAGNFMKEVTP